METNYNFGPDLWGSMCSRKYCTVHFHQKYPPGETQIWRSQQQEATQNRLRYFCATDLNAVSRNVLFEWIAFPTTVLDLLNEVELKVWCRLLLIKCRAVLRAMTFEARLSLTYGIAISINIFKLRIFKSSAYKSCSVEYFWDDLMVKLVNWSKLP